MQHGAVKTEATLDGDIISPTPVVDKQTVRFTAESAETLLADGLPASTNHIDRHLHPVEPPQGSPVPPPRHSKVKFAAEDDQEPEAATPAPNDSNSRAQQAHGGAASLAPQSSAPQQGDAAAQPQPAGFLSRLRKSFDSKSQGGNSSSKLVLEGSFYQSSKQSASQDDQEVPGAPAARPQAGPSILSATIKGLLDGASSRVLGSLMRRSSFSRQPDADSEQKEEELWFESLDDFKPICHMLHKGRYMSAYFACANKTGQHFLLKKFDKHKMVPTEERGVRRAIAFSELLQHQHLVKCMGQWEADDIIYVVEEYAGKGDIFNDAISHPEKYTEHFVAVKLVKQLLRVLAYMHGNNIIHRSILPENLYMHIDDVLKVGHLTLAIDQLSDRPKSRTGLLDYMAPEMLSVKPHNEQELARLLEDSSSSDDEDDLQQQLLLQQDLQQPQHGLTPEQQQLHQQDGVEPHGSHHQQQQQKHGQLDVLGRPVSASNPQHQLEHQSQHQTSSDASEATTVTSRRSSHVRMPKTGDSMHDWDGQTSWENLDYYDEKVDIWQVGCLVHELLCGSMPFEVDSKIDSAGLALWADLEQPPGSLPPDCIQFLQQCLTKDPKQRPTAEQLMQHPWLARCESGEPWRDQAEMEAARKAAELATFTGWLRHHGRAAVAVVTKLMQQVMHGSRVQPMGPGSDQQHQQQQQGIEFLPVSGPPSPTPRQQESNKQGPVDHLEAKASAVVIDSVVEVPIGKLGRKQQEQQQQQYWQQQQAHQQNHVGGGPDSSPIISGPPPLALTEELVSRLNAGWEAKQPRAHAAESDNSADSLSQQLEVREMHEDLDDAAQTACVVSVPDGNHNKALSFAVGSGHVDTAAQQQKQQRRASFTAVDVL